jgi:DNA polymerase-3 subunit delta
MWSTPRLAQAIARANQAAKAARLTSSLEEAIAEELLIALAGAARPPAGRA